jgi:hypothetical protein
MDLAFLGTHKKMRILAWVFPAAGDANEPNHP